MLPPASRLPEARTLVEQQAYFVVHAPRQTGKTTTLLSLARELTAEGRFAALHFTCETGESAGDDALLAQESVVFSIRRVAEVYLPPELRPPPPGDSDANMLRAFLARWAAGCPRPLVLFFDEIDALRGASLIAVLRQLRADYQLRPAGFPWSVALVGLRDVRDYKAASGGDPTRLGSASPFNISVDSLRLGDFSEMNVQDLLAQHGAQTGQPFTEPAVARVFELSQGQPWLVNALAREAVEKLGIPATQAIDVAAIDEAKERLVLARATHLDSLVAKLREPRVRRVIEPLIDGASIAGDEYDDDASYVRDLGLVAQDKPLRVANPIYREVIVRVLGAAVEDNVTSDPRSFVLPDGRLDFPRLLDDFVLFWKEHGDVLAAGMPYHEVAPQLVLMAYLQRIVNGGGYIDREYGIGRGRIDLLVRWPHRDASGKRAEQREAIELKVWKEGRSNPTAQGLAQLDAYLHRLGLDTGLLAVFDRRSNAAPIEERTHFEDAVTPKGSRVRVLFA